MSVQEAYAEVGRITRREAKNFAYGIMVLPREKRQAIAAIYAFARGVDDIADGALPAEEKRAPNMLCEYAFELGQAFSRFYAAFHILSESDDALRAARLGLCGLSLAVLTKVLALQGIEVPERM